MLEQMDYLKQTIASYPPPSKNIPHYPLPEVGTC